MDHLKEMNHLEGKMKKCIEVLKNELQGLRTGRASPTLLEPLSAEAYGQKQKLNQLGTISVLDPHSLSVQVWDKSLAPSVEKAIRESSLNLNPMREGTLIRVPLPQLNEERRTELAKVAGQYAESARVAIRNVRREGMDAFKKEEKDKNIGKDESKLYCDKVQKLTDDMVQEVDKLFHEKEKDIQHI